MDERDPGRHVVGRERLERLIEGARGEQLDAAGERAVQHGGGRGTADPGGPAGDVGASERAPQILVVQLRDVVDARRRLAQDRAPGMPQAPRRRRMIVRHRVGGLGLRFRDRQHARRRRRDDGIGRRRRQADAGGEHGAAARSHHRRRRTSQLDVEVRAARRHDLDEFPARGGEAAALDPQQIRAGGDAAQLEAADVVGLDDEKVAPLRRHRRAGHRLVAIVGDDAFDPAR
jgi:hypothetical protein